MGGLGDPVSMALVGFLLSAVYWFFTDRPDYGTYPIVDTLLASLCLMSALALVIGSMAACVLGRHR